MTGDLIFVLEYATEPGHKTLTLIRYPLKANTAKGEIDKKRNDYTMDEKEKTVNARI